MATRTQKQRINDYEAIVGAIKEWGGCKEPELAAICGIDDERVRLAVKMFVKLGFLAINAIGEVVVTSLQDELASVDELGANLDALEGAVL